MKFLRWSFLVSLLTGTVFAQTNNPPPSGSFPLWNGNPPGVLGNDPEKDIPTLTTFLPEPGTANGAAMVILPGGGYAHLAGHEGEGYAHWLTRQGITCFVLKYRLGSAGYRYPVELEDAARAIRLVRARASEWNLDPNRVGIIGSSAGGHLTSMVVTHFDAGNTNATDAIDRQSSRPNVAILCYPVITMGKFTHQGSKDNLLGQNPSAELVHETSSELQVRKDTPPCFLWSTDDDSVVPIENTLEFVSALRVAKIPYEVHIYQSGPHGQGLGSGRDQNPPKYLPWADDCIRWLKLQKFIK